MELKTEFPGRVEAYHGYRMHLFTVDGCDVRIVEPLRPLPGKRWVWKAEFFEAFPTFELEMLKRGFFLAYMNVGNTFGCPDAMRHFDRFYEILTGSYGFHRSPILLGLSRGGLYVYNWACANPARVGCVCADNPVCDFKSWPGGKGTGPGSPDDWRKLLGDYHFKSEADALAYRENPVDKVAVLVNAGVPMVHAAATGDSVVPFSENTELMERRVREAGGELKVFRHPGDHHPHGLPDPAPLIEWILQHSRS